MGIYLSEIFSRQSIILNLNGKFKDEIFTELTRKITDAHPECDETEILEALWERENKMTTGIISGAAIPHALCGKIKSMAGAIGISGSGIDYDALDNKPVYVVFLLIMGDQSRENHLRVLNQIIKLSQSENLELIRNAKNTQDICSILSAFH